MNEDDALCTEESALWAGWLDEFGERQGCHSHRTHCSRRISHILHTNIYWLLSIPPVWKAFPGLRVSSFWIFNRKNLTHSGDFEVRCKKDLITVLELIRDVTLAG